MLRGVNVGGRKMEMVRLRRSLAEAGFAPVTTYLQSGNAVISVERALDRRELTGKLAEAVADEFGFECAVVVRDASHLAACVEADPFLSLVDNPAHHLIGFCSEVPNPLRCDRITAPDYGRDQIRVVDDHLYMWCPNGFSQAPFFKMKLDRELGVDVTVRNWNTVTKLIEMTTPG